MDGKPIVAAAKKPRPARVVLVEVARLPESINDHCRVHLRAAAKDYLEQCLRILQDEKSHYSKASENSAMLPYFIAITDALREVRK